MDWFVFNIRRESDYKEPNDRFFCYRNLDCTYISLDFIR